MRIKGNVFACLISTVELVASEGGRKKSSSPAREPSVEKKLKTSSATRSSTVGRLVVDLSSSRNKKEPTGSELVKLAASRVTRTVANKITHLVPGFIPRQPSMPKFDPIPDERVVAKSKDGDSTAKTVSGPTPPVENETPSRISNCDQPTKLALGEFSEIHVLLKLDLLKGMEAYDKFVDGVNKVVDFSFFTRHEA